MMKETSACRQARVLLGKLPLLHCSADWLGKFPIRSVMIDQFEARGSLFSGVVKYPTGNQQLLAAGEVVQLPITRKRASRWALLGILVSPKTITL